MRLSPVLILAALVATPVIAAPVHTYGDLAINPAGDRIASIDSMVEPNSSNLAHARIVIRSAASGAVLRTIDPCAPCNYSGLTFARDGRLAFLAAEGGKTRLMIDNGGAARTLATIDGIAQVPRFSPDGRTIALLATFHAQKQSGATQAGVRQVGEIGQSNDEQQIALVPAAGGTLKPLSPADTYIYEYDWTPDGRGFVVTDAKGNGDNNWWVAALDRIDAASGAMTRIAAPSVQLDFPRVSPDGQSVAFIGGLMSDFGSVGGDVYVVPIGGGTPRNLSPGYRGTFTSLAWDRSGLTGSALIGDRMAIVPIDPARGPQAPAWSAPVSFEAGDGRFARAETGAIAAVVQDFEHAPAIYAGPISAPRAISHDNDKLAPLVRAQSVRWRSDGADVQGWLLAPLALPAGGKAPMITTVHGGPSAATTPRFLMDGWAADAARAGYYLFYPNPRGSYGQGEAFTSANIRDFGGGDLDDILAGVDAAEKAAPIDDARLGLYGHSYGGFMAMWANTRTNRFKAIVAGAGISNWLSYYGTNGIDQWMIPFFGKSLYDDPAPYWAVSAVRTIHAARTPTLIYVGERDIEVPPTQSIEFQHALDANQVPNRLVIYADEGHGIRAPANVLDLRKRITGWFDHYLVNTKPTQGMLDLHRAAGLVAGR